MPDGKIEIIDIASIPGGAELLTSYDRTGRTRDSQGRPNAENLLRRVGDAKAGSWRASRATATALVALDGMWRKAFGRPVRLTDAARDPGVQANGRAKYENWIAAGKPAPSSSQFVAATMKSDFVGEVNRSNHQWGGAVDLDVVAMCSGDDHKLSELWDVADDLGFMPIISKPSLAMSECWHFDHLETLGEVRDALKLDPSTRHNSYTTTAEIGCILAGTYKGDRPMERLAQARLAVAATIEADGRPIMPGVIDGILGTATIRCAQALGLELQAGASATDILTALGLVGAREIADL